MLKFTKQYLKATDVAYILICIACSLLSVFTLASIGKYLLGGFAVDEVENTAIGLGGYRYAVVQACAMAIGLLAAVFISCVDYRSLAEVWPVHTAITAGLVLPTLVLHNVALGPLIVGYSPEGTDNFSWYKLAGVTFQPAELLKISFVLSFAPHLEYAKDHVNEPGTLIKLLMHMAAPVLLIHVQGDDGSAMVFAAIGCCMLFAAGLAWRYIIAAIALVGSAALVAITFFSEKFLKNYQFMRIMAVLYPDDPAYAKYIYQQNQAKVSIGAGRVLGRGLFGEEHHYVTNAFNDFIFSYMAEAVGFFGCILVLLLLFALLCRTLSTGLRSKDSLGRYICVGIFAAMAWQTLINLGMNLAVLPVIGITLPFFSGGGSSMLMLYVCVGLVLSVYIHNRKHMFD